jgi:predicted transcriptional regulator
MASSKAIAAYRGARALELSLAGVSQPRIADELGFRSSGAVSKALWRTINRRAAAGVDEYRAVELERLDAIQSAHWDKALDGDAKAAEVVLSVIDKRIKLLGLDHVADGSTAPGKVVDSGFWEHVLEEHGGKMSHYLDAHADGACDAP